MWIDKAKASNSYDTPYRFTGKERDTETGLYYYGARYYDAKYSRWLSCDPALGEYIPQAPENDAAKKHNKSLAGQGGVFNVVNLDLYHYAANNPVKYTDPDGKEATPPEARFFRNFFAGQIEGAGYAIKAGAEDAAGKVGNFFSNLVSGNGDVAAYGNASLSIGNLSLVDGTVTSPSTSGGKLSLDFSPKNAGDVLSNLSEAAGMPISVTSDGVKASFKMGSVSMKDNGNGTSSLSIELTAVDKGPLKLSAGMKFSASTQDGPCGTIENGGAPQQDAKKAAALQNIGNYF